MRSQMFILLNILLAYTTGQMLNEWNSVKPVSIINEAIYALVPRYAITKQSKLG